MKTAIAARPKRKVSPAPSHRTQAASTIKAGRILVPVDFSDSSRQALNFAKMLGEHFGAAIDLVHVFGPEDPFAGIAGIMLVMSESEIRQRIRRYLHVMARQEKVPVTKENIHAIQGRPFEEICQLSETIGADLIVIPTKGNSGLKHFVLGSTAERVVRHASAPVLVLRRTTTASTPDGNQSRPRQALSFRKIIVPIDFSECSLKGMAYAKAWARKFGSTLLLVHCLSPQYYVTSDECARYDLPALMDRIEKIARARLRDLVQKTEWEGVQVETALEIGHPGQQICQKAQNQSADLIVTSTHGHTGFKHLILGSTAEYVARHAPCSVLVVPTQPRTPFPLTKV